MVIPLDDFIRNCKVKITDIGKDDKGNHILGMCTSLQPLKEDGTIDYTVYISDYLFNRKDIFSMDDIGEIALHEKLHLYCLTQFGIVTEDIFIDYWLEKIKKDYI